MKPTFGKLNKVDLRKIWNHEAHDFTKWLAEEENLSVLSDEIGIDITLIDTEVNVGSFNVDILAEEESSNRKIVIENQLESTDHDHLGKLITYASGHDAEIVIWIVKNVREEHKQAIDWLNEHTDDKTYFFLIKMEVWQIDSSSYAPKFQKISEPNDWAKTIKSGKSSKQLTETKLLQQEYWLKFKEYAEEKNTKLRIYKAYPQHWLDVRLEALGAHIGLTLNKFDKVIGTEIYIPDNKRLYYELEKQRDYIEEEIHNKLEWMPLEDRKACRIKLVKKADYQKRSDWENQFKWLLENTETLYTTFNSRAKRILKEK